LSFSFLYPRSCTSTHSRATSHERPRRTAKTGSENVIFLICPLIFFFLGLAHPHVTFTLYNTQNCESVCEHPKRSRGTSYPVGFTYKIRQRKTEGSGLTCAPSIEHSVSSIQHRATATHKLQCLSPLRNAQNLKRRLTTRNVF
jgi:hypothetical protein